MRTDLHNTSQSGNVRSKGNQWYYRFYMMDPDGVWRLHEFKGGKNKRETEAMLRKALDNYLKRGFVCNPKDITVYELALMWYEDEIDHSALSTNGRNDYKNVIHNHIKNHALGSTKLKNVTCEQLQAYVDEKYYGKFDEDGKQTTRSYSESHMRKQFIVLNNIFKYAVYPKHYLIENPMQYIKKRKKAKSVSLFDEEDETKVETITHEEYLKIVDFLSRGDKNYALLLPIQIAYYTGLRAGEVCGLTWEDIDLKEQYLTVRRSMYYDKETRCWELKTPKNGKSRIVDFGNQLTQILRKARKEQLENQLKYGPLMHKHYYQEVEIKGRQHVQIFTEISPELECLSSRATKGKFIQDMDDYRPCRQLNFVCAKQDGELLTTQTLKWCNKVVQRNVPDMRHFHFHCLRHSYATNLITNGANFKDVQALLGHSDIKITMNTYAHVNSHSRKRAVDILERAIGE